MRIEFLEACLLGYSSERVLNGGNVYGGAYGYKKTRTSLFEPRS